MQGFRLHAKIAWLSAWRSHGFRLIVVLGLVLIAVAYLAGAFSLRQPLVVTLDVGLSGIRVMALLLSLFWVQEIFSKDVERHTILFVLSYPVPRSMYVLGRYTGVMGLAAVTMLVFGLLLAGVSATATWGYQDSAIPAFGWPYFLTLVGIWLDIAVVTAFVTWLSTISVTPFLPLIVGFLFAVCARSLGATIAYLMNGESASPDMVAGLLPWVGGLQWLIPDLGRLDWRSASLYHVWPAWQDIVWSATMALSYSGVMLVLACRTFSRREFQ